MRAFSGICVVLALGCGGSDEEPKESGGEAGGSAAQSGAGGTTKLGGSGNVAGSVGTGGSHSGGATGAGGSRATGGATGAGGARATGGATGAGGASSAGGSQATGGAQPSDGGGPGPNLVPGIWTLLSPIGYEGFALDHKNPSTLYFGGGPGFMKSTDYGASWNQVGSVTTWLGQPDHLAHAQHSAVDPDDSNHLYATSGVVGNTMGFWISTDGGQTFTQPSGWHAAEQAEGFSCDDTYDLATDPADFRHVLVTFHSAWGWTDTKWNMNSGVMESKDGGATWTVHAPASSWGTGHAISFLSDPAHGLGNSDTWLLHTQGAGFFRTTDAGAHFTKVSDAVIQHGGGNLYYTSSGVLYASGTPNNLRSTDNGISWTAIGPNAGYNAIFGDGTNLYTMGCFSSGTYITSKENDGNTWKAYNDQSNISRGPYIMDFDRVNRIMYSASWEAGLWALRVVDP